MAEDAAAAPEDHLESDRLIAARLAKVESLRADGVDPYPVRFERTATAAEIRDAHDGIEAGEAAGVEVTVAGRLRNVRDLGKLAFGVLQDWSGTIQLFADAERLGDGFGEFTALDAGDWVGASGEVMKTKRGELSVNLDRVELLAKSLRPMPEKWHGLSDIETRYRRRYVDLIVNEEARDVLQARVATIASLRDTLEAHGFVAVETPTLHTVPSGGLATPFSTHHNALDMDMYLRIALELHLKRLVVGGVERVYEIGRVFRNEGVSPRHNPEFTMLELYQAFADYLDMAAITEELVTTAAQAVCGTTELSHRDRPLDLSSPWRRATYLEVLEEATGRSWGVDMPLADARRQAADVDVEVDESWTAGRIVVEAFEERAEDTLWDPTVVLDYPIEISPLARAHRDHPGLVERFEVIVAGTELANAFSELNDPVEQRRRFEAQAEAKERGEAETHPMDEDFLVALEHGMPPTGGMGMGVDRLVALLTNQSSLRDVILFPHLRPEA